MAEQSVDFVIVGLGNPQAEFLVTRHNAGYIFADYLANCISMQATLLAHKQSENELLQNIIPADFKRPVFERRLDLSADVNDSIFSLTEADMHQGPGKLPENAESIIKKQFRILIVKPLTEVADAGHVVKLVLEKYQIENPAKQLIVVFNDTNVLPGTLQIQQGSDSRGADQHRGTKNIFQVLGHKEFIRFRMGIGRSTQMPDDQYVLDAFPEQNNEINLFGYTLDLSGQAIQHIIAFGDVKATKKKFCSSKKLPKTLRKLPGLLFPVDVEQDGAKLGADPKPAENGENSQAQ